MLTLVEQPSGKRINPNAQLSLAEYLALPDDTRMEIVEGVLRPIITAQHEGAAGPAPASQPA